VSTFGVKTPLLNTLKTHRTLSTSAQYPVPDSYPNLESNWDPPAVVPHRQQHRQQHRHRIDQAVSNAGRYRDVDGMSAIFGFAVETRASFYVDFFLSGTIPCGKHHSRSRRYVPRFWSQFTPPKRRFWKVGRTFQTAVSKHFSMVCSPNTVLTPLKSASKTHSEMFVRPFKIFVWGA
jgi:hypothetical protein